jgi:hypothetical protein
MWPWKRNKNNPVGRPSGQQKEKKEGLSRGCTSKLQASKKNQQKKKIRAGMRCRERLPAHGISGGRCRQRSVA